MLPFIKNYKWTDENGDEFSSWEIFNGKTSLHTGDTGAKRFNELLMQKGIAFLNPKKHYYKVRRKKKIKTIWETKP